MNTDEIYDIAQEESESTEAKNEVGCITPRIDAFDTVADIIADTCDIPRDKIRRESHAINDLGIDSLDFLDVVFGIDKAFGIKLPLEQWTQEVNDRKATTEQYFVLDNLCARIGDLVAAKGA
jgi:acyl carrier protein